MMLLHLATVCAKAALALGALGLVFWVIHAIVMMD
jgi:hypothetical protein